MPWINELTVNSGLAAYCLEPGAVEKGRQQWVANKTLIQSGNRPRRAFEGTGERRIDADPGGTGLLW
jgi:hypothetical protein